MGRDGYKSTNHLFDFICIMSKFLLPASYRLFLIIVWLSWLWNNGILEKPITFLLHQRFDNKFHLIIKALYEDWGHSMVKQNKREVKKKEQKRKITWESSLPLAIKD